MHSPILSIPCIGLSAGQELLAPLQRAILNTFKESQKAWEALVLCNSFSNLGITPVQPITERTTGITYNRIGRMGKVEGIVNSACFPTLNFQNIPRKRKTSRRLYDDMTDEAETWTRYKKEKRIYQYSTAMHRNLSA
jgi:hypothetical protein